MEKAQILIVEDERLVAEDIKRCLIDFGYSVISIVNSGNEALDKIKPLQPDLILMDIVIKGNMNGIETANRINSMYDIPIIYLTAYADRQTLSQAKLTEPFGYIIKPFNERELHSTVEMALYKHRMEKRIKENEKWLDVTLKCIGDGVISTDVNGNIRFMNPVAEFLTMWNSEDAVGKNVSEVFRINHIDEDGNFDADFMEVYNIFDIIGGVRNGMLRTKDEKDIFIKYNASLIEEDTDEISGAVLSFRDVTNEIRAIEELKKNRKLYKDLVETVYDWIWEIDDNFVYTFSSKHVTTMLGYSPQEIVGKKPFDFMSKEAACDITRNMDKIDFSKPRSVKYEFIHKNGSIINIESKCVPVFSESNEVIGHRGINRDITDQTRAENALKESEAKYKALIEGIKIPKFVVDEKGTYHFLNRVAAITLGGIPDDFIGKSMWDLFPKHVADIQMKDINLAIRTRKPVQRESKSEIQGQERWYEANIQPLINADGTCDRALGMVLDITENVHARKALEETELRYRELFENMSNGVAIYEAYDNGADFVIKELNEAGAKITNVKRGDVVGKKVTEVFPGVKTFGLFDVFKQVWQTGIPQNHPLNMYKDNKVRLWAENYVYKLPSGEIVAVFDDLTQRKTAEEEKNLLEEQLRHSQRMEAIGRLAGGIAHDFNNMLTAILGNTELMINDIHDQEMLKEDIEEIQQSAERAAALTRQLLTFSRRRPIQLKILNLNELIKGMNKMLLRLIGEDISLKTSLEPELGILMADPGQIEQVIMNVIVNSSDAMPNGGRIWVCTENVTIENDMQHKNPKAKGGSYILLSISDNGTGMSEETLGKIFEPFFTTKELNKGTGLGLSVVYGIVKQHEGWVEVESKPEEGTTFRIFLPACDNKIVIIEEEVVTSKNYKGRGEKILLIEDEYSVRKYAARILRENGYTVVEAEDGTEAVDKFENNGGNFDLIFSDVVLPDISGLQLVEEFMAKKSGLIALLTSGYTSEKAQWEEIIAKGIKFLNKPYSTKDLLKTIREVVNVKANA